MVMDGKYSAVVENAMAVYEQVLEDGKFQPLDDGVWRFVFERDGGRLAGPLKDFVDYREMLYDLRLGRFRDHVVSNAMFPWDADGEAVKDEVRERFPMMVAPLEGLMRRLPSTKWKVGLALPGTRCK